MVMDVTCGEIIAYSRCGHCAEPIELFQPEGHRAHWRHTDGQSTTWCRTTRATPAGDLRPPRELKHLFDTDDALVWAREFVATVRISPMIATDVDTMLAWFACAIVTAQDVARRRGSDNG